jgi:hypothetical protein
MTNQINLIRKAQSMELIKSQISITLTKGELNQLIAEALADPESSAAIKKVLNPLLTDKFPQFPDFTVIALGDTDESGSTQVILKQPATKASKDTKEPASGSTTLAEPTPAPTTPIKSIEPVVITDKVMASIVADGDIFDSTPAYVEPEA